jgi:PAS domain S-box-containing protein
MSRTQQPEVRQEAIERLTCIGSFEWVTGSDEMTWSDQLYRLVGHEPGEITPGIDLILSRTHPGDRPALRRLIELQRDGGHQRSHVFRLTRPDGEVRFLLIVVGEVISHRGGETTLLGTVQDVTERHLTSQGLAAYQRLSDVLGSWDARDDPMDDLLAEMSHALEWDASALWVPDEGQRVLECVRFWARPGVDVSELEVASRSFRFPADSSVGRAVLAGGTVNVPDVDSDRGFLRRDPAVRSGLHGWASFPVLHGDDVVAVVELYSRDRRQLGQGLDRTLDSVGRMLGEFLAWRRAHLKATGQLTRREREVLQHAADGRHIRDSASELEVSPATIKGHFRNIYEKLGVSDRAAAVAEGMRLGLVR